MKKIMLKFKNIVFRFVRDTTVTILVSILLAVFIAKTLIMKLRFRRGTDICEENINRIESLIQNETSLYKGFFLYTFIIQQFTKTKKPFYEGDLCAFITIAAFELNLTDSEKVYLCMKHTDYAKYITLKFKK